MTAFILIMLYVHHEFNYDKFNENYDRIYRLEAGEYGQFPPAIYEYVKDKISGIENITRLATYYKQYITYVPNDNPEGLKSIEVYTSYADSTLFDVFTLPFVQGNPKSALKDPFTAVLTESTAKNLFDDKDPMDKTLEWWDHKFRVTGIIKDVKRSHIEIGGLFSYESIEKMWPDYNLNYISSSGWLWSATYLLLGDNMDQESVEEKINQVLAEINDGIMISVKFDKFTVRPLKDVYFKGHPAILYLQFGRYGNLTLVRTFMAIAVFILVLACINYINLTTARATLRSKEVAMKKVVGSSRFLLRYQFITESILVTLISFLLAFTLIQGLIPLFSRLAMVNINMSEFNTPIVWVLTVVGIFIIGIISGIYPAIYLTSIKSVNLIKGESRKGSGKTIVRKSLMIFQFSISIILIVGIITNLRQINYARTFDLGFKKDYIIQANTPEVFDDQKSMFDPQHNQFVKRKTIKERLLRNPKIQKVSFTTGGPGGGSVPSGTFEIDGKEYTCQIILIDPDYLDLMGIELLEGRNFYLDNEADKWRQGNIPRFIINETAAKQFYKESPVSKILTGKSGDGESFQYEVIGMVKDFNFRSIHHDIPPVFMGWNYPWSDMKIKISSNDIPSTIKFIENEWRVVYGTSPFSYSFLDETFDEQYKGDEQGAKIIGHFAALAIIIACLGLFALSSFMALKRTKEIGIRKSLGASSRGIFLLLTQEFVKWVLTAVVIACPVAWVLMNKWLQTFTFHINLKADIFILAALIALVTAMLTVTWQSLKTARANPVEALRYE